MPTFRTIQGQKVDYDKPFKIKYQKGEYWYEMTGTPVGGGKSKQVIKRLESVSPKAPILAPAPTPAPTPKPTPVSTPTPSAYKGVSIVDYLKSVGQPSDYSSRSKLAQQHGIANYTGTAKQNTQLLNTLRVSAPIPTLAPTPKAPTPKVTFQHVGYKPGKSVGSIARKHGLTEAQLRQYNPNADRLAATGEAFRIPIGLPAAPVLPTEPTVDPNEQLRIDAANLANKNAQDIFDALPGDDIDIRESAKILEDIQKKLRETEKEIPKPTSLVDLFESKKAELGIEPLEQDRNDLLAEKDRLQASLFAEAEKAGEKLVSTREIGRAKGVLQKRFDREMMLLNVEISAVERQLGNKYDSLEMVMSFTQQDFTNASTYYTQQYNRTISLFSLVLGLEEKEYTRAEDAERAARANWDIVTNLMKENSIAFGDLTDDQKLKIKQFEVEAGLLEGFSEKILATVNPDKTIVSKITSTDKSQISILYEDGTVEVFKTKLAAEPKKLTAKEKEAEEITAIKERLIESKRGGDYVDGNVYLEERRKSSLGPTEFDKRFGDLLSPGDRVRYGLEKEKEEKGEEFITTDYIKENISLKALEDYAKENDYKGWWTKTKVENLLKELVQEVENWRVAGHSDKTIWAAILKKIQ